MSFMRNDLVWVPCEKEGYKLLKVDHVDLVGRKLLLKDSKDDDNSGPSRTEKVSMGACYKYVSDTDKDDNTSLTSLDPANILENIRVRFGQGKIYTSTAHVLLAMNPYRDIPNLYSETTKRSYYGKHMSQMPPHPYSIADYSYRNMVLDRRNHAIVISGESGAGKTETAKIVMSYLAEVGILPSSSDTANTDESGMTEKQRKRMMQIRLSYASHTIFGEQEARDIQKRILSANPILEAFGNARTVRNYNSSRFGRLNKLYYNEHGFLKGGGITTYLLESSRCVKHNHNERTYHCFYQLVHGATEEELKNLYLERDASKYSLLNQGNLAYSSEVESDREQFNILRQSLNINGVTSEKQTMLFQILSGIILLGNIVFKDSQEKATLKDDKEMLNFDDPELLANIAHLFGISTDLLVEILLVKQLKVGNNQTPVSISRTSQQSLQLIHSIIRSIYIRIFNWVVSHINRFTSCKDEELGETVSPRKQNITNSANSLYIGILDIYGFEKLEINSFEQLCINLANEKLQEFFVEKVLQSEQKLYQQEGLVWTNIEIPKTQPVLDLIFDLFSLLDDDSRLKSQGQDISDFTYWQKINNKYGKSVHGSNITHCSTYSPNRMLSSGGGDYANKLIKFPLNGLKKLNQSDAPALFSIKHYAGSVEYTLNGWLEKNHDKIIPELEEILENSSNEILNSIIDSEYKSRKSASFRSVSKKFTKDLKDMIQDLGEVSLQFIRCFIPNSHMRSDVWNGHIVLNQMIQSGTIQMVKLMHYGYPNRASYSTLIEQIRCLLPEKYIYGLSDRMIVEFFLSAYSIPSNTYQFGISKLFLKSGQYGLLLDQVNEYSKGNYDSGLVIPNEEILIKLRKGFARKCLRRCILVADLVSWMKNRFIVLIKKRRQLMNLISTRIYRWYLFYKHIILPLRRQVEYRMPYIMGIKVVDNIIIESRKRMKKYFLGILRSNNEKFKIVNKFENIKHNDEHQKLDSSTEALRKENSSELMNRLGVNQVNLGEITKAGNMNTGDSLVKRQHDLEIQGGLVGLEIWKQEIFSFVGYRKNKRHNYLIHYDGSSVCLLEMTGDKIKSYELFVPKNIKEEENNDEMEGSILKFISTVHEINKEELKEKDEESLLNDEFEYYSEYCNEKKTKRIEYELGNPLCFSQHPAFSTSFVMINEKGSIVTFKLIMELFPNESIEMRDDRTGDMGNNDDEYWDLINSTPSTKLPNLSCDIDMNRDNEMNKEMMGDFYYNSVRLNNKFMNGDIMKDLQILKKDGINDQKERHNHESMIVYMKRGEKKEVKEHISAMSICSSVPFNEYIPFEWLEMGHIFVPLKIHYIDPTSYQYLGILWHVEYSEQAVKDEFGNNNNIRLPIPISSLKKNKRRNVSENSNYVELSYNKDYKDLEKFDGLFTVIDLSTNQIISWLNFPFRLSSIVEEWTNKENETNKGMIWDKKSSYHPKCWCNLFGFAMKRDSNDGKLGVSNNTSLIYDVIPTVDVLKETCFISSEKLERYLKDTSLLEEENDAMAVGGDTKSSNRIVTVDQSLIFLGGPKLGLILSLEIQTIEDDLLDCTMNLVHDIVSIGRECSQMDFVQYSNGNVTSDISNDDMTILEKSCWFTTSLWLRNGSFNLQKTMISSVFPNPQGMNQVRSTNLVSGGMYSKLIDNVEITLLLGTINGRILSINLNRRNCPPKIAIISPFEMDNYSHPGNIKPMNGGREVINNVETIIQNKNYTNTRSCSIVSIFNLNNSSKISCVSSTGDMVTIQLNSFGSRYIFSDRLHICLDKRYRPFIIQFVIFNSKIGQSRVIDNNLSHSFVFLDAVEKNLVVYNKNLGTARSIATII